MEREDIFSLHLHNACGYSQKMNMSRLLVLISWFLWLPLYCFIKSPYSQPVDVKLPGYSPPHGLGCPSPQSSVVLRDIFRAVWLRCCGEAPSSPFAWPDPSLSLPLPAPQSEVGYFVVQYPCIYTLPHKNACIVNLFSCRYCHPVCWAGWPPPILPGISPESPWRQPDHSLHPKPEMC